MSECALLEQAASGCSSAAASEGILSPSLCSLSPLVLLCVGILKLLFPTRAEQCHRCLRAPRPLPRHTHSLLFTCCSQSSYLLPYFSMTYFSIGWLNYYDKLPHTYVRVLAIILGSTRCFCCYYCSFSRCDCVS